MAQALCRRAFTGGSGRCRPLAGALCAVLALLGGAAALGLGAPAQAAGRYPAGVRPQLGGVALPETTFSECDDATALSLNPAGLGFTDRVDVRFYHSQPSARFGEGEALLVAARVLGPWALGLGFEFVRWPELDERVLRFDFGTALALSRTFSIGLGLHAFLSDRDPAVNDLVGLDLGFIGRPFPWWSIGVGVLDLNTPTLRGATVRRKYRFGSGFRLGTERAVLSADLRLEEGSWDADPALRLRLEPFAGIAVIGEATFMPRPDHFAVEAGVHLAFSLGYVGVTAGTFFSHAGGEGAYDGFSVGVRAGFPRERTVVRPGGRVAVLTLGGDAPELPSRGFLMPRRSAFGELLVALRALGDDPKAAGLLLKLRGFAPGWAQAEELRGVIAELRKAGKRVWVYAESADSREYSIAAAADRVFLHPGGGLRLQGFSATLTFYRGLLDKLGVEPQFVRIGRYKSYPETFVNERPSEALREARDNLYDVLYAELVRAIATGRALPEERVRALIDGGPYLAAAAAEAALADGVLYEDELADRVRQDLGPGAVLDEDYFRRRMKRTAWGPPALVAVVAIEGNLVDGKSLAIPWLGLRLAGGDTIVAALEKASKDPRVRGIILRVNTPGGDVLAADKIHRAVQLAAAKKPLVASFGDTAASAGYYFSAAAPRILSGAATLTGSIGIFTGKPVLTGLFDKLGIHRETFRRGRNADLLGFDRRWNDEDLALVESRIRALYDRFLQHVAAGRKMPVADVDAVGQGRVWAGSQALARRLVDAEGGFLKALDEVRAQAKLSARVPLELQFMPDDSWLSAWRGGAAGHVQALTAALTAPEAEFPLEVGPPVAVADSVPLPQEARDAVAALAPLFGAGGPVQSLLPVAFDFR